MADEIDLTTAREDLILAARIRAVQTSAKQREHTPLGHCLYCEEPFTNEPDRLFCDVDCREDHQKYIK